MDDKREQFSLIYDQYIGKIYRFVYIKVNSRELAQDITSRVFLKGWEAFKGSADTILNPSAFLYQIARNMVVDHYRQKGGMRMVSQDVIPEMVDTKTDIHERAVDNADLEAIKAGIKNLKKEYQDVLIWHYLEDMPVAQIAQLIEKPAGTVRVMLHRGLKALKDNLIEEV